MAQQSWGESNLLNEGAQRDNNKNGSGSMESDIEYFKKEPVKKSEKKPEKDRGKDRGKGTGKSNGNSLETVMEKDPDNIKSKKNKATKKKQAEKKLIEKKAKKSKIRQKKSTRTDSVAWKKQIKKYEFTKKRAKVLGIIIVLFIVLASVLGYIYFFQIDTDGDGIPDAVDDDDDNDGMPDDWEEHYGFDPKNQGDGKRDKDGDGLKNREEYEFQSNPKVSDTDNDDLNDFDESKIHHTLPNKNDTDSDGMPDGWEVKFALDPLTNDGNLDYDNDGYDANHDGLIDLNESYTNLEEYYIGTNPRLNDSDHDGMWDGWEMYYRDKCSELKLKIQLVNPWGKRDYNYTFDPLDSSDAIEDIDVVPNEESTYLTYDIMPDGLDNLEEFKHRTDPTNSDSDKDGLTDFEEIKNNTNPLNLDTDDDWLWDGWEIKYGGASAGLDPTSNDTDNDGVLDKDEDLDNDTFLTSYLFNLNEFNIGTSPVSNDTDGDGLIDGWEVYYSLNPLIHNDELDTDNDNLSDRAEFENGTNPKNPDTDGDKLLDGEELIQGFPGILINGTFITESVNLEIPRYFTNPLNNDTDGDGLNDSEEVYPKGGEDGYVTNATNNDTDGDGIEDLEEVETGEDGFTTNPANEDTDGDWLTDKEEIDAVWGYYTKPTIADDDEDGLLDGEEVLTDFYPFSRETIEGTNPNEEDTDGDGMDDGWEAHYGFADRSLLGTLIRNYDQRYQRSDFYGQLKDNPEIPGVWLVNPLDPKDRNEDPDFDGYDEDNNRNIDTLEEFNNSEEFVKGTNPLAFTSDKDNMSDGWEVYFKLNPLKDDANGDKDNDGIHYYINGTRYDDTFTNLEEYETGEDLTGPLGVPDGIIDHGSTDPNENTTYYFDLWFGDNDDDGLVNGWELLFNGTPLDNGGYVPHYISIGSTRWRGYFNPNDNKSMDNTKEDSDNDYDRDNILNFYELFTSGLNDINTIMNWPGSSDPTDRNMTPTSIGKSSARGKIYKSTIPCIENANNEDALDFKNKLEIELQLFRADYIDRVMIYWEPRAIIEIQGSGISKKIL